MSAKSPTAWAPWRLESLAPSGPWISGMWAKAGHGPAQRLVDQRLARGVVQVVVAADHVGDAHVVVVDHHGEVVGRRAVGAQQDQVVELACSGSVTGPWTRSSITVSPSLRALEAHHVGRVRSPARARGRARASGSRGPRRGPARARPRAPPASCSAVGAAARPAARSAASGAGRRARTGTPAARRRPGPASPGRRRSPARPRRWSARGRCLRCAAGTCRRCGAHKAVEQRGPRASDVQEAGGRGGEAGDDGGVGHRRPCARACPPARPAGGGLLARGFRGFLAGGAGRAWCGFLARRRGTGAACANRPRRRRSAGSSGRRWPSAAVRGLFRAESEPPLWPAALLAASALLLAILIRRWLDAPRFAVIALTLLAFLAAGMLAAKLRTLSVAAPLVAERTTGEVSGWVVDVASPGRGGGRLLIAPYAIDGVEPGRLPRRVRVTVGPEAMVGPGAAVRIRSPAQPAAGAGQPRRLRLRPRRLLPRHRRHGLRARRPDDRGRSAARRSSSASRSRSTRSRWSLARRIAERLGPGLGGAGRGHGHRPRGLDGRGDGSGAARLRPGPHHLDLRRAHGHRRRLRLPAGADPGRRLAVAGAARPGQEGRRRGGVDGRRSVSRRFRRAAAGDPRRRSRCRSPSSPSCSTGRP